MKTTEKITRAKIQIQRKNSFFAYLSLYLKFKEDNSIGSMGINAKGEVIYNSEFVDSMSNKELQGTLIHEILHLVFLHLVRLNNRDMKIWNIATDLVINVNVLENGFSLPDGTLKPYLNTFEFQDCKIEKINTKLAEEIYNELMKKAKKQKKSGSVKGDGNDYQNKEGGDSDFSMEDVKEFDKHIFDKNGKELTEKEKAELSEYWSEKIHEAYISSKLKGDLPQGIERFIGEIHKNKVDWKSLLKRYIERYIPYNHSYKLPHKKSISTGFYMPDYEKEMIDITIVVDLSGSIGEKELNDFMSEIIGMAKAFKDRLKIRLLTHEVNVTNDYLVENGNIDKIKKLKMIGGGGTSHKEVFDYIRNKKYRPKVVIFLTDGHSDLNVINMKEYNFSKIFLISSNGTKEQLNSKEVKIIDLK